MIIKDIVIKNDKDKEFELEVYLNIASIKGIERELALNEIEYLNSLDLDIYSISTLNAYCNDVYGEDVTIIIEF
jgi:hypothetical protein